MKLADFGVATHLSEAHKSDSVVGTPYWSELLLSIRDEFYAQNNVLN